jgi:hypothetical protein
MHRFFSKPETLLRLRRGPGLLPARLSRIVQLPQIANGPLSWTIGCADGLHQRPIPVLLTVFAVGAETYWGDGVRRKAAVQVGWSALHRVFNRRKLKTKYFQKKNEITMSNLSVGDELRLTREPSTRFSCPSLTRPPCVIGN